MNQDQSAKIIDGLTTVVLLLDQQFRIRYLNPAAEQFFASSANLLYKTPVAELLPLPSIREDLALVLSTQQGITLREVNIPLPNQPDATTADYTITPLSDQQLLIEIRKLDRLLRISREDQIVSAQQATQSLVKGVAHEVKNPLGGIRGAAQLLEAELEKEEHKEYINVITEEVDRLRNLVDRMLGPKTLPTLISLNIHEITERVRSVINVEANQTVRVTTDYDPSLPELIADKDQLIQCLLNIMRNALQALQENPEQHDPSICIRTRAIRQHTIGNMRHRLCLLISIEDNGPGIPRELQETLFYPMISGRANGTGLGLSIAQAIVSQHHGLIECESKPGATVFRIVLPYIAGVTT